jgi:hypothetical protein
MAYEIVTAVATAAQMSGIGKDKTNDIFYNNGIKILEKVENR